jgi:uncharacterized protein (TIGR00369 family)
MAGETPFERLVEEMRRPPFQAWLNPVARTVDEAKRAVVVSLAYKAEFSYHPTEPLCHGGVLAGLVDVVGHAAVAVWHGAPTPTISLQIDFLRPAMATELIATGALRQMGHTASRADAEISADGKLVALGRGTFPTRRDGA